MLRNQDEDELRELLSETYANHTYMDKEIEHLLLTRDDHLPIRHIESSDSLSSGVSDGLPREELNATFEDEGEGEAEEEFVKEQDLHMYSRPSRHIFDEIYAKINSSLKAESIESIRQTHPLFLLSQPGYEIKDHIKSVSLSFSGNLLRKNILVMDVGYCEQEKAFKVAVGTDEGSVVIFEPNSSKPQHLIDCFSRVCTVTCVKWSKNLQYLAIANDQRELHVYCFKQQITIEHSVTFRPLKRPEEFCALGEKSLRSMLTELNFIGENPFRMVIVDENDDVYRLEMRKHVFNTRPHLASLPIKFSRFLDLTFHAMQDARGNEGVLMAVSGESLITICQVEPQFEVAMVYDKEKHGSTVRKSGFPHVAFRSQPNSMLVIWDKYLQIMRIEVEEFTPFRHRFSITHKLILPDSTVLGGFLSNTFIYQVNRVGIKVYSTTAIEKDLSSQFRPSEVFFQKVNFQSFCYGERIEEFISDPEIEVSDLRFLKGLFKSVSRNLFYCTNKGLQMVYFQTLQQYINAQVENNNWKIALEVLKDCYLGKVHALDEIHPDLMQQKIRELASRYINFLETIIVPAGEGSGEDHMQLLWNQELIFVFNILIATDLQLFLLEDLLVKIHRLSSSFTRVIIPFILMNRITKITHGSLEILVENVPIEVVSRLVLNLQTVDNDPELPHQINNLLIRHELLLEFIDLNQKFRDYYTPLAVLVGIYLKLTHDTGLDLFESAKRKRGVGRLLAYAVHETLSAINFNKHGKEHNKETLDSILRLLMEQIFAILIREEPVALFENILEELYMGSCLEALNQLDVLDFDGDLMKAVVDSISYAEVVANKCEKKYWVAIFKLYSRRLIVDLRVYQGLKYLTIDDQVEREFLQKFVQKCHDQIQQELESLPLDELTSFFESLLFTHHICLVVMVGKILRRYITTLDAMLADGSQRNEEIYGFIYSFIQLIAPPDLRLLRELLKRHIQFFIEANARAACDVICKYFLSDLNIFIDDLNAYPLEQLKLIRSVLELYAYSESLIDLKVRYLTLLAANRFHEAIFAELQKENYPLDESLHICKQYEVHEALAYLLVKSGGEGSTEAAIRVYFKIIEQKIAHLFSRAGEVRREELEEVILRYLKRCIEICSEVDVRFHHHYDNEWFIILEELEHFKKAMLCNWIVDSEHCEAIRLIINRQAYPALVQSLLSQIEQDHVVMYLRRMMGKFDLEALQIIIEEMMRSYLYEKRIFLIAELLLVQAENHNRAALFREELTGFATDSRCSVCGERGDLLFHYGCGHENHPACSHDVKDCILCAPLTESIYRRKIGSVTGLRIDIYSSGPREGLANVERQIDREEKLSRMRQYEELNFVDL